MNQTETSLAQDDDIDRTMEEEVRRVRMDAILTWPTRESARPSYKGQNAPASIGKAWARSGLLASKDALKASASVLERVAGMLNQLATTCKKDEGTVEA